jgi:chromosomal replication initiation ATPase DnaA
MRVSIRRIQKAIADDFGIPVEKMTMPRPSGRDCRLNTRQFHRPRQYAMLLARELTAHSFTKIGEMFHRDHSTVIAGIRAAEKRLAEDKSIALKIEARALLLTSEPRWF